MYQDFMNWSAMGKNIFGPWTDIQDINYRAFEKVVKKNIEMGSDAMAHSIQYAQNMQSNHKPEDYVKNQINFMTETMVNMMDYAGEMIEVGKKTLKEYQKISEKNIDTAFSEIKPKKNTDK